MNKEKVKINLLNALRPALRAQLRTKNQETTTSFTLNAERGTLNTFIGESWGEAIISNK